MLRGIFDSTNKARILVTAVLLDYTLAPIGASVHAESKVLEVAQWRILVGGLFLFIAVGRATAQPSVLREAEECSWHHQHLCSSATLIEACKKLLGHVSSGSMNEYRPLVFLARLYASLVSQDFNAWAALSRELTMRISMRRVPRSAVGREPSIYAQRKKRAMVRGLRSPDFIAADGAIVRLFHQFLSGFPKPVQDRCRSLVPRESSCGDRAFHRVWVSRRGWKADSRGCYP